MTARPYVIMCNLATLMVDALVSKFRSTKAEKIESVKDSLTTDLIFEVNPSLHLLNR